jgi:hypothetical protein
MTNTTDLQMLLLFYGSKNVYSTNGALMWYKCKLQHMFLVRSPAFKSLAHSRMWIAHRCTELLACYFYDVHLNSKDKFCTVGQLWKYPELCPK